MSNNRIYRIGTRGSRLALAQAEEVVERLTAAGLVKTENCKISVISTAGDRIQDRPLSEVGGKGLFSKEIESALLENEIDFAVHSTKDMASILPDGLKISSYLPREDVRDAFLSPVAASIEELPHGAVVGSSSLRRQALLKRLRPDLEVVMFRGNVQTRMKKLDDGEVHATLLAQAGLRRLGLIDAATILLDPQHFPPAPGQGAICIESRNDDREVEELVRSINDTETETVIACERAFLRSLDGSCRTPIAGLARRDGDSLRFAGMVLSTDGSKVFEAADEGVFSVQEAEEIGRVTGEKIRGEAGADFFHHWS